uniref:Uncharacterized protein n=1 Tax=Mycena chlorophos TaxID=658473 RepID=A0ABQ0L8Y5_MYCCL|nr:predicted protein [Mycena chlorophos]
MALAVGYLDDGHSEGTIVSSITFPYDIRIPQTHSESQSPRSLTTMRLWHDPRRKAPSERWHATGLSLSRTEHSRSAVCDAYWDGRGEQLCRSGFAMVDARYSSSVASWPSAKSLPIRASGSSGRTRRAIHLGKLNNQTRIVSGLELGRDFRRLTAGICHCPRHRTSTLSITQQKHADSLGPDEYKL